MVGVLETVTDTAWSIRRRDGSILSVDIADIEAQRVVPPTPAQRIGVDDLERIAARGWRALETEPLGGWLLRASGGFTGRANSALCLGPADLTFDAAVDKVRKWYAARSLPARLQVPLAAAPSPLVEWLTEAAWSWSPRVHVMTAEIAHVLRAAQARAPADPIQVGLADSPDAAWLAGYRQDGGDLPSAATQVLTNHDAVVFAAVRRDDEVDEVDAIARVGIDGRWAGLFAVEVNPALRRRGLASAVSAAALRAAGRRGARHAYLQVSAENTAAIHAYKRLNFTVHHDYAYAEPPA